MNMESDQLLVAKGITKKFGNHTALKNVSFKVNKGEIVGLVGANGSGKSTLMNILYGNSIIDETGGYEGKLTLAGADIKIKSTKSAIENGIGMVHQEFALFPAMTVVENIKLCKENTLAKTDGLLTKEFSLICKKTNTQDVETLIRSLGISLDTSLLIQDLSTNMKQFVEIARELDRSNLKLLILDEPTAVLNEEDSRILMSILKSLSEKGVGILFISHRLDEIKEVCHKVIVLRDGENVGIYESEEIKEDQLAQDMIGKEIIRIKSSRREIKESPIISFSDYHVNYAGDEVNGLNLDVFKGEILGVTSLSGQGKLGVSKGLMGLYPIKGQVVYNSVNIMNQPYHELIKKGIYVLCEDRKKIGLLMNHSIKENIIFTANQVCNKYGRFSLKSTLDFLNHKEVNKDVESYMKRFEINSRSANQRVCELSGGNQQKVCLARALTLKPKVLFLSEPTRGIDIGAKEKILESIKDINVGEETTVVIASSELDELIRVCDRIAVLCEGKLVQILRPDSSPKEFGYALSGIGGHI